MRRTGSNGIIQITQGEECKGSRAWATANHPPLHVPLPGPFIRCCPTHPLWKPGQASLCSLCGVHDCEWWREVCWRNVLLSNVYSWMSIFTFYRFSPGCMQGTNFCNYLIFFFFLSLLLGFCMVFFFSCSLVSAERVHQVIHNQTTPTPRPTELNTQFLSHHRPHLHLVLTYDWAEIVSTIYRCKQLSCFPVKYLNMLIRLGILDYINLELLRFFWKAHQGAIYLIKIVVKIVALWNIITM